MPYVTNQKLFLAARPKILTIKEHTSFGQTFKKIRKSSNADFIVMEKPQNPQMLAALILKIAGRKFFWVQNFSNPPVPNLFTKILISQADRILVKDKKNFFKLKSYGINTTKIHFKIDPAP